MALKAPYWSATHVNISSDYKQVHLIITHINYNQGFDVGKTKVNLQLFLKNISDPVELTSHVIDISKHVKPTALNTTLDVGYFIIPTALVESAGKDLVVGIHVIGQDGTVDQSVNSTVYMDIDDYFQTI
jgi:hypothetical protein